MRGLARWWPYLLLVACYLATSPYHRGLNNPNEMVRVYMSRSLAQNQSFDIGPVCRSWGYVDDKAVRDGVLLSSKAPLQSLMGVPGHLLAEPLLKALGVPVKKRTVTHVLRLFGTTVFGLLMACFMVWWARRRCLELGAPSGLGTGLGLAGGLGTMVYPFSITFTGHLLAALTAFAAYIAVATLGRHPSDSSVWRRAAILAGFFAGAAPFAEYPAALLAAPVLVAAFFMTRGAKDRVRLIGLLAVGGALPFALGLWAHHQMWGAPWKTGYSFLENANYVVAHAEGFFGVTYPKPNAVGGALFSPSTGMLFYSPLLVLGFWGLFRYGLRRPSTEDDLPRALGFASLAALFLSLYFIGSHSNWRGGWTVGPRYIIGLAPVLWLWSVECVRNRKLHALIAALGALSILLTGFVAALYPHLSDVYTNPLWTFVWASYRAGEMSYGVGHALGFAGHAANMFHVVPLFAALLSTVFLGLAAGEQRRQALLQRLLTTVVVFSVAVLGISFIPENNADAARRENRRLWGFWEPATPGEGPLSARWNKRTGHILSARQKWRSIKVSAIDPQGKERKCVHNANGRCVYGDLPWQNFGPNVLNIDGVRVPLLQLHPIANSIVRATLPAPALKSQAVLRYGLTDASVVSPNPNPVHVRLLQNGQEIGHGLADNTFGLKAIELTLTSTQPVYLEITNKQDGARVFGFDWVIYPPSTETAAPK